MWNRSLLIITMACIVLAACALGGCTGSTNTTTPQATAVTSTAAQSTPTSAPASGTFTTGVTKTDTGYIVKGNTGANDPKLDLKAGTYTFHITLSDFSASMSGQAYLMGTGALAGNQVKLVVFTDPTWGSDMTITQTLPADGTYKMHVSYLNNWEVDISQ